jgi:4'-phosphopantetheinyl transferase EntD
LTSRGPTEDGAWLAFLASLRGVAVATRRIQAGDETAAPRSQDFLQQPLVRRRASGAARIAARELLKSWGVAQARLERASSGAALWPEGFVGSLAHDADFGAAAVARVADAAGLGIDIEPAAPLPIDLHDYALNTRERAATAGDAVAMRMISSPRKPSTKRSIRSTDQRRNMRISMSI